MSLARYDTDERSTASFPRCSKKIAENPTAGHNGFFGNVRKPDRPDEYGAINIIEVHLVGAERIGFFPIPGDPDRYEVRFLDRQQKQQPRTTAEQPRSTSMPHTTVSAGPLFGER